MILINNQIAATAEVWADLKVPYVHRGFSRNGCDCSGLLVGVLQELGFVRDFEMPIYPIDWLLHDSNPNHLTTILPQYSEEVKGPIIRGDILLFRFAKVISHLAIFVGGNIMVHSQMGCPVSRDACLLGPRSKRVSGWSSRFVSSWRISLDKLTC